MGEGGSVGAGQAGDQPALVALVVQQGRFLGVRGGVELAALVAVGDRDLQGDLRGVGGGAIKRYAALDQGAEHGEEAASRGGNRRGIGAGFIHVAVAVEQVGARHADVGEVQTAVIDAVQPALQPVIFASDAFKEVACFIADRHVEAVHAVVHALGDQLREDGGGLAVQGRRCPGIPSRRP